MLEVIAAIPVIGVVLSLVEGVVIGAAGSYSYYGSYALEAALFGSLGLLVLALIASAILGVFFKMFADIAVMHFAVTGRVESAFSLDKVWAAFKHKQDQAVLCFVPSRVFDGPGRQRCHMDLDGRLWRHCLCRYV